MNAVNKVSLGFSSFATAHRFIKKHKLWHFVLLPGLLNIFVFYFSLTWFSSFVVHWVASIFETECGVGYLGSICNWFADYSGIFKWILSKLFYIIFLGVYLYVYKSFILVIYSPVLAYLIEVIDKLHKGNEVPFNLQQFIKDTVRGVMLALRALIFEGLFILLLILLAFIPVVNLIQPILMWLVGAYFLGTSMMDYSLERKGYSVKDSVQYNKSNKSLAFGLGSVFQLLFLIPFVGWMIAPTYSAVAAYFAVDKLETKAIE